MADNRNPITHTRRLLQLADESPDTPVLICVEEDGSSTSHSRGELAQISCRLARCLEDRAVEADSLVVLALPNSVEHVLLSYASWHLGACVLPLSPTMPLKERASVLAAAASSGRAITVIDSEAQSDSDGTLSAEHLVRESEALPSHPLPDVVPHPGRAIASGGSTGLPKIIADMRPHVAVPDAMTSTRMMRGRRPGQRSLILGPLYHTLSHGTIFSTLFDRGSAVLMRRFDAAIALESIEKFGIHELSAVPTHLLRIAREFDASPRDLSSLESVYHSGASCPAWLKRRWIELIGAARLYEGFGSTEAIGMLVIRGDEWLKHPGSVGRGQMTDVVVRGDRGESLPPGEVGEIFMRWKPGNGYADNSAETHRYWGVPPAEKTPDGFASVGDMGWLNEDGYLFVADRRTDMIISGGVNVFPAEVESALSEHPDVSDAVVIGIPDSEWGTRVHAIIQIREGAEIADSEDTASEALDAHCRVHLAAAKVPKTYEYVEDMPRNEAGKVRRSALAAERSGVSGNESEV